MTCNDRLFVLPVHLGNHAVPFATDRGHIEFRPVTLLQQPRDRGGEAADVSQNACVRPVVGMARVLRGRIAVAAAETTARIAVIVRTEKANLKRRNKGPRPESLLAIERAWRDLPAFGLLDQDITCTKKSLVIVEHRMVANKLVRLPGVSILDEPGVVIVKGVL